MGVKSQHIHVTSSTSRIWPEGGGKAKHLNRGMSFLVAPGTLGMMGLSEARLEVERASVQAKQGCRGGMDRPSAGFLTQAGEEWGGSNLNAARQGSQESFLQNQVSG